MPSYWNYTHPFASPQKYRAPVSVTMWPGNEARSSNLPTQTYSTLNNALSEAPNEPSPRSTPPRRNIHTFMGLGPKVSLRETVATRLTEQQAELFDVPLRQLGVYDEATAQACKGATGTTRVDLGLATHDAANALGHMAEVLTRSGHSPTEAPLTVINGLLRPPPSINDQP